MASADKRTVLPPLAAVALICVGAMVAPLDTAVNVAFPNIVDSFGVAPREILWVVLAFVFTQSVASLFFGRLGDLYGHRRMFMLGMLASAIANAALALAPSYGWLIGLRALQGAAAGMAMACAPALVSAASAPEQRGRFLALYASAISAALAIGPVAGGLLTASLGWPGVFLFRAPIALAVLMLVPSILASPVQRGGLDAPSSRPKIAWRSFLSRRFVLLQCSSVAIQGAVFAIMLWVPFALARWSEFPITTAGLVIAVFPAGSLAASLWLARGAVQSATLTAQSGVLPGQWFAVAGLAGSASVLPLESPLLLALTLSVAGIGLGVFQVSYQQQTLDAVAVDNRGLAGSLINVTRLLGIVVGVIGLSAVGDWLGVAGTLAFSAGALAIWTLVFRVALRS